MKKKSALILAMLLTLALALASCSSKMDASLDGLTSNGGFTGGYAGESWSSDSADWDSVPSVSEDGSWDGVLSDVADSVAPQTSLTEKIIYSASIEIETVDFDAAVDSVSAMLEKYGAFLESSNVSGKSYSAVAGGMQTYRRAYFTIRVPVKAFEDMKDELGTVGSVLNTNVYTSNITERYYDTEARVRSYEIEQERLLAMLEKCGTVSEMIEIENRLSEVRYELESLESTLRNWQNQVDYSTITVNISEVEEYRRTVEIHRTYWEEIGDGLRETLEDVGDFFKNLFKLIVVNLPVILLLGVVIAAVIVVIVKLRRRRRARWTSAIDAGYTPARKDGGENGGENGGEADKK